MRGGAGHDAIFGSHRAASVERTAETVEHAAEHGRPNRDAELLLAQPDRRPGSNARQVAERNERYQPVTESDDLGADHGLGLEIDPADRPELENQASCFDGRTDDPNHLAGGLESRGGLRGFDEMSEQRRDRMAAAVQQSTAVPRPK
jgi:hypothetical protein